MAKDDYATPKRIDPAKTRLFILVTGFFIILAMAYGSGMRGQIKKLQNLTQDLKIARRGLRSSELARRADIALLHQLEARRLLDLSLESIAARNYGIAVEQLKSAVAHLETASEAKAANTADLETVLASLKALTGESSPNPSQVSDLAHQMDLELGKVVPKADYVSLMTIPPPTGNDEVDPEYEWGKRKNP